MMTDNSLSQLSGSLKGTKENMHDVSEELGITIWENILQDLPISQCSHCDIWMAKSVMKLDSDKFNICPVCLDLETLRF
jgi:hypothetical protein